jgi:hypothetical protein
LLPVCLAAANNAGTVGGRAAAQLSICTCSPPPYQPCRRGYTQSRATPSMRAAAVFSTGGAAPGGWGVLLRPHRHNWRRRARVACMSLLPAPHHKDVYAWAAHSFPARSIMLHSSSMHRVTGTMKITSCWPRATHLERALLLRTPPPQYYAGPQTETVCLVGGQWV